MSTEKPLRIVTAFGTSRAETILLAVHPDEEYGPHEPIANRRTLVLKLRGDQAVFQEEVSMALVRSWCSPSGIGYCSSIKNNRIYIWSGGQWSEEVFSPQPVSFVRFVFGLSGAPDGDDTLFLSSKEGIFIRQNGRWARHPAPGDAPFQIHGIRPNEVFIGGTELLKWNGQSLEILEGPDDDAISGLWVTSDDRLIGGDTTMSITRADGSWKRIACDVQGYFTLTEFNGYIYASSFEDGVVRIYPGPAVQVTPSFESVTVISVGDGLVAVGDDRSMVFDGQTWSVLQTPLCEVGKKPR